ncbi:hypothetical protein HT574_05010 [Parageobacillus sp. VR-IP]|jgi:hypothetical protein|uniref:hypothetical protein n=1 Tax=Anoxybacillaceae TaxID=3120669 RepID=UPI001582ECE1|nr:MULTISPECIES: hypothetical protein [Parageobacillus]NUK29477.1 hypothetical protein [Parageobacillus sp. VR-IP]BDG35523.1 hypothetical protein PcaKH15_14290 [Parageobacillus caldoxylosilyticus]BDG39302.1 hypothetical protein PcaKH16_14410 [Parageobacillus caldoxylosilyticus]BDG43085.1 hypothetical protein PcaKH35_14300 [Parageobacillus caldoxylosilyticus]
MNQEETRYRGGHYGGAAAHPPDLPRHHRTLWGIYRTKRLQSANVAINREIAVLYKEIPDELNGPELVAIISSNNSDCLKNAT